MNNFSLIRQDILLKTV